MKRLLTLLICLAALLGISACGLFGGAGAVPEETTTEAATTTAATTNAPTTAEPIKVPDTYKDAPVAYKPVLDEYYKWVVSARASKGDIEKCYMPNVPLIGYYAPIIFDDSISKGYAIKDINNDGIPELFILPGGKGSFSSIFTLKDGEPVRLEIDDMRKRLHISADGTIYSAAQSTAASYTELYAYKLEPGAGKLSIIAEYRRDHDEEESEKTVHFQLIGGEKVYIEESDLRALYEKYYNPPADPMHLEFISIEKG